MSPGGEPALGSETAVGVVRGRFRIVDADTRRPVRASWFSAETVLHALYQRLEEHAFHDFLIVDEGGVPVPVSRVRRRLMAVAS